MSTSQLAVGQAPHSCKSGFFSGVVDPDPVGLAQQAPIPNPDLIRIKKRGVIWSQQFTNDPFKRE
jgi:hypothetical protein